MFECATLEVLHLESNGIADDGAHALANGARGASRLHTLGLAGNSIGCDGGRGLARAVRCCPWLQRLDLSANMLVATDRGAAELHEAAGRQAWRLVGVPGPAARAAGQAQLLAPHEQSLGGLPREHWRCEQAPPAAVEVLRVFGRDPILAGSAGQPRRSELGPPVTTGTQATSARLPRRGGDSGE